MGGGGGGGCRQRLVRGGRIKRFLKWPDENQNNRKFWRHTGISQPDLASAPQGSYKEGIRDAFGLSVAFFRRLEKETKRDDAGKKSSVAVQGKCRR